MIIGYVNNQMHSVTKKRKKLTKKELSDCNEISYEKTFEPNTQMIKIWCPMNELRELQRIQQVHIRSNSQSGHNLCCISTANILRRLQQSLTKGFFNITNRSQESERDHSIGLKETRRPVLGRENRGTRIPAASVD